ncbi:hypothetical protein MNBD_ACTINO02-865 [hydrothermal vent metagenome]|uniref:Uncharacterized protein n=1 Tax=hydrothermal vent metagenome TaxID=652676 RepID=A0A3B0SJ22_9ZZZZ
MINARFRILVLATAVVVVFGACSRGVDGAIEDGGIASRLSDFDRSYQAGILAYADSLRTCMAEQGFDYVVDVGRASTEDTYSFVLSESVLPPREFIDEYGFGIVASGIGRELGPQEATPTPNERYRSLLSEAGRVEYDMTLSSCLVTAERILNDIQSTFDLEVAIFDIDSRVRADRAVVEATLAWSRCMAEMGWSFDAPGDPVRAVVEAFNRLSLAETGEQISPAMSRTSGPLTPIREQSLQELDTLDQLLDAEIRLATDEAACQDAGYRQVVDKATVEAERKVLSAQENQ